MSNSCPLPTSPRCRSPTPGSRRSSSPNWRPTKLRRGTPSSSPPSTPRPRTNLSRSPVADSEPADSEPADSEPADSEPADSDPSDEFRLEDAVNDEPYAEGVPAHERGTEPDAGPSPTAAAPLPSPSPVRAGDRVHRLAAASRPARTGRGKRVVIEPSLMASGSDVVIGLVDRHSGAARRRWGGRRDAVPGTRAQERRPARRGGQRRPHGHRTGPECRARPRRVRRWTGPRTPSPSRTGPAPTPDPEPEAAPEPATYRGRLGKARGLLSGYLGAVRSKGRIDAATWDDLEEALIRADVGVGATDGLLERPPGPGQERGDRRSGRPGRRPQGRSGGDAVDGRCLAGRARGRLRPRGRSRTGRPPDAGADPVDVWLFVGVNGVGKTTTIGKVANRLSAVGHTVLLAAGRHLPGRRR